LHYYAQINGAPTLQNSILLQTSVLNLGLSPTSPPTYLAGAPTPEPSNRPTVLRATSVPTVDNQNVSVGLIIGVIVGFLFTLSLMAVVAYYKQRQIDLSRFIPSVILRRISTISRRISVTTTTQLTTNPIQDANL
jgi:hypothetical protein